MYFLKEKSSNRSRSLPDRHNSGGKFLRVDTTGGICRFNSAIRIHDSYYCHQYNVQSIGYEGEGASHRVQETECQATQFTSLRLLQPGTRISTFRECIRDLTERTLQFQSRDEWKNLTRAYNKWRS